MTAERRVVVSAEAAAPARVPADGGAPPGARSTGPAAPEPDPPDPDPLHTVPVPGTAETRALIRAQLRTALGTCAIVATLLVGLPLLALVPAVARARAQGVPLCWLVLVLGVQPVWIAVSLRQLGRAERAERAIGRR
ncbi:hypothetical protein [Actinomadura latina]|uniref:DUF485 domain-containing protein n=1 Tax=Actinomadura latina TaxID=163603 RepID=A0A846Z6E3_9ACTN|nr:hypothetical protein [Actinomadura latina]NKZ06228.1 hypothetical protein [Actinomadura latina]